MKLNATPRIVADSSVYFALKEIATVVNPLLDQMQPGAALGAYANDADAASAGVKLYGFYRIGNVVQQRIV